MYGVQMNKKAILATLLSAALVAASGFGIAADKPEAGKPGTSMHGGKGMGGMQGMQEMQGKTGMSGMMPMMDMMSSCDRVMQSGAMGHGIPQLPPGNAKLQLQMQAEVMQKTGEILAKYATQISEEKR